jgi:hypothetical protein
MHLSPNPHDQFPIQEIPIQQVDYRWGEGSPERRKGGMALIAVYQSVSTALSLGAPPPDTPPAYKTRYPAVKEIFNDLGTIGLRNPLIVWEIEPGRYLTLVGNQRRCALEATGAETIPCRVANVWRGEQEVLRAHPPEVIIPIEQLDFRWASGTLDDPDDGQRLMKSFPEVIRHLKAGTIPEERTIFRYFEMARAVAQSVEEHGLANYLLVYQVSDFRFLVMVGNQRLLLGRVWNWPRMPCRVSPTWDQELLKEFSYIKVAMPWPM